MRTPARIARHPMHPMLVPLPVGLWVFSLACDLVFAFGAADPVWKTVALYTMVGGLVGALVAAVPGLIDLLSLRAGPRRTAIVHMAVNVAVAALFGVDAWLRASAGDAGASSVVPVWLSLVAVALLGASGWLGGKLVYEHGVAVDREGSNTFAGRPGVIDLARFREQRKNRGKRSREAGQRPRTPEPPISSRKP